MDQNEVAARLTASSLLIVQANGLGDTEHIAENLEAICGQLDYDQSQFDAMLAEAAAAYQSDRGRDLIDQAFAAQGEGGSPPAPSGRNPRKRPPKRKG
jgi:hypothetical protein